MQPYGAVSVPAQVAATLRRKIYAGEYLPGTALAQQRTWPPGTAIPRRS
jgi:DNA-binding GntR family transcriptional regulator